MEKIKRDHARTKEEQGADSFRRTELKKRRQFRKFTYRGIDLDQYARIFLLHTLICLHPSLLRPHPHPTPNERYRQFFKNIVGSFLWSRDDGRGKKDWDILQMA